MPAISGVAVWEIIACNQYVTNMSPKIRAVMRPFIEASPNVLEGHLDRPFTLQNFAEAKMAFLQSCIEGNLADQVIDATNRATPAHERALACLNAMLKFALESYEPFAQEAPALLEKQGITEAGVLLHERLGLNEENKQKYIDGSLTIGDVLQTQPAILLGND